MGTLPTLMDGTYVELTRATALGLASLLQSVLAFPPSFCIPEPTFQLGHGKYVHKQVFNKSACKRMPSVEPSYGKL